MTSTWERTMSAEPEAGTGGVGTAASPDVLLRATGVVAGYVPEVNILNGLDLTLGRNEFVGIIGPNGAGKSTFLKAVLGLVPIRDGTVVFQDEDITGHQAHQLVPKGVGFVPQ